MFQQRSLGNLLCCLKKLFFSVLFTIKNCRFLIVNKTAHTFFNFLFSKNNQSIKIEFNLLFR